MKPQHPTPTPAIHDHNQMMDTAGKKCPDKAMPTTMPMAPGGK